MFKNIKDAIKDYLNKNPDLNYDLGKIKVAPAALPIEYNDTPYCTVVNGHFVHTIGEYKAEVVKYDGQNCF